MKEILETIITIKVATIMLVVALLCSCALFSGCTNQVDPPELELDYNNARRATVAAWEEVVGPVSLECNQVAINAIVTEVDTQDKFPESCKLNELPPTKIRVGCNVHRIVQSDSGKVEQDYIYILANRTTRSMLDSAVHEYIHLLSTCEYGDGDPDHIDAALWDRYGTNTVEAYGCANLEL